MSDSYRDTKYNEYIEREMKINQFKRKCKHCGWTNIIFNKYNRKLCKNCNNMIYLNEKDEFKNKLKGMIK